MLRFPLRAALLAAGLAAAAATGGPAFAQKSFTRDDLASEGVRLEDQIRRENRVAGVGPAFRREGEANLARREARAALDMFTKAIAVDPRAAASWAGYARAARAVEPANYSERYQLGQRAVTAAYMAYQRAGSRAEEASALALLGEALAARESWRPALDAYRASLALADSAPIRATYEDLRAKRGFRVLDYKVDSDSASPRACFQFSEPLSPRADFTPFVTVGGAADAAVSAEGAQLCVDGLRHGRRYGIVLRQGLPSSVGEDLLRPADYAIYVRDRSPQVRFTGRNYVLPRTGQQGIPVVTVNASEVLVDLHRIGDRNLLPTLRSEEFLGQLRASSAAALAREKGAPVWSGRLATGNELNRDVTTAFPALEATGPLQPGVYVMTARVAGGPTPPAGEEESDYDGTRRATQWFVVSDLGLTALKGPDGVHAVVRSLASGAPLAGVELRLVARNNEVLATRTTDGAGRATFDPGLARGEGGLAPGLLVANAPGGGPAGPDYGFLDLQASPFDLTDRGVKGRAAPAGLDAFVATERGVYRSGETVHATALLRDRRGQAAAGLPLTLVLKRPDGVEHRRETLPDAGAGGRAWSIPILSGAQRGTWRVQALVDPKAPPVGEATFLLEDYVPERLELTLSPKAARLRPGEPAQIDLLARYLYGAPGAELDVTGEVAMAAAAGPAVPGLEGYAVGLGDEEVEPSATTLEDEAKTGPDGRVAVTVPIPAVEAARPVEAKITLRVAEPGGRAVERSVTLPVGPAGPVVGVKKLFASDLPEGGPATFDVVLAEPDGRRLARAGVPWSLYRVERSYQWFNADGRWGYEPVKSTRRVADGRIDLGPDAPARISAPVELGSYRLDVAVEGVAGARTTVAFSVGYGGEATADTPDLLEVTLDKPGYRAGEPLQARLKPRAAGRATVAVVAADGVRTLRDVDLPAEGATVSLPVEAEWGSGAYLVATAYRPLDGAARRMPGRALGLAWFSIDRAERDLSVAIGAPAKTRPRGRLSTPVRLGGLAPGEDAFVTVAAVDVGILNLTRYATPDPSGHFFGQKALPVEIRDLYGFLIDGMGGAAGAIRSGGDAAAGSLNGVPPTQAPLAFFSGAVKVGSDGTADVGFDLPAFNGTVRVTAVAWSRGRTGAAATDVIVRDPVVVTGALPRFLNVGDRSRLRLDLDNMEGAAADYVVSVDVSGPVLAEADALRRTVRLGVGGKGAVTVPIAAAGPGDATLTVRLSGPDAELDQRFALRIQPGTGATVRRTVRPLEPGGSAEITADLLADILPGTGAVSVSVSPLAALDVPGLLQALDRYPYGCTEQTVSRALPLLYVNRLAEAESLGLDGALDERVRGAVERVLSRQDSNGAFGLWSAGGSDDLWLDAYATDFLLRARELRFAVPQRAVDLALERLRNFVANAGDSDERTAELAYAAYVLARAGRPIAGDLRYLADTRLAKFATPLAQGQIAAALGLLGDRPRAAAAFASAVGRLRSTRDGPTGRADYGTRLRDGAALLALASETGVGRDALGPVTRAIEDERGARTYTSTQENAWMVLAAEALSRDPNALRATLDGRPVSGPLLRTFRSAALERRSVRVGNAGAAAVQLVVNVTGAPIGPEPAAERGYGIERAYHRLDGSKLDVASVRQGDRLVAVLTVTEPQALPARVLLVDRLPAGFEIDNPRLVDSDAIGALDWLKTEVQPVATEYRDDRFVAAFDRAPGQPAVFRIAYLVRATAPGRYVHPAAAIEDMYRPDRFGRTAFGSVEVAERR